MLSLGTAEIVKNYINKSDINLFKSLNVQSNGFSIEIETMVKLVLRNTIIKEEKD